jgi:hypothetical protein
MTHFPVTLNCAGKALNAVSGVPKTFSLLLRMQVSGESWFSMDKLSSVFNNLSSGHKVRQWIKRNNVIQITSNATPCLFF